MTTTGPTFAQAQAHLAARRQQREAEANARDAAARSASRLRTQLTSSSSPLIRSLGSSAISFWDAAHSREGTRPAFRVGQVDAELLDEELLGLLRGQVNDALRYLGGGAIGAAGTGGRLGDEWAPEIMLALRAVLFKLTIWDHDATYGAALQNLRYTDARRDGPVLVPPSRLQKSIYGAVTVGGRYLWGKWEDWLGAQDNGYGPPPPRVQRLSRITSLASNMHATAAFISFLAFLVHGRYRTLLDRLLRLRLAPPTSQVSREVSFEYLNRQLVWHAFTEFLLFFLPLIGINRWRRWLARTWRKTRDIITTDSNGDDERVKNGEFAFLPERTCAICYQDQNSGASTESEIIAAAAASSGVVGSAQTDITNPYETVPCRCIYCFVCLATRLEREEGEGWTCLRCGELVKECKPWSGDVLEPVASSSTAGRGGGGGSRSGRSPTATHKAVAFADDVKVEEAPPSNPRGASPSGVSSPEVKDSETDEGARVTASTSSSMSSDDGEDGDSEAYEEEEDELGEDMEF